MSLLITNARVEPQSRAAFAAWQAELNARISNFPGFVSLEMTSPNQNHEWVIVQRFKDNASLQNWKESSDRKRIFENLKQYLANGSEIRDELQSISNQQRGVTEIFVAQVPPEKEEAFREWIGKIHQAEAKFPGFKSVYVQSPSRNQGQSWITLLQFDTLENLDRWVTSHERKEILKDAEPLMKSLDSHRVISPYAGWFASLVKENKELPPVWKQTMLILLVLFPIVMLEFKFLNPLTAPLNISLATFIGNAISVCLVSWPLMPIAIRSLGWWLVPDPSKTHSERSRINLMGTLLILGFYLIEVLLFWNLIPKLTT